jgi:hypothetical protein
MLELIAILFIVAVCVFVFLAAVSVVIAYVTQAAYTDPNFLDDEDSK